MLVEKSFHRLYSVPSGTLCEMGANTQVRLYGTKKMRYICILPTLRVSKKPLFKKFAIYNMLIIKCDFSGNNGKITFLDITNRTGLYDF
jgi:hypothetical protein